MNRINSLFERKQHNILTIYFTAGYPSLDDTERVALELVKHGVDLIEIGVPFSDPMADGPVIQQSSQVALANGMSVKLLLEQVAILRTKTDVPIVLMGYLNPIWQYGIKEFCKKCKEVGVDGLILPDLPMKEYMTEYKELFKQNGLHNIFLITPQTSDERIREIDAESDGFIYMVSSAGTTGAKSDVTDVQVEYFNRVKALELTTPLQIGFGISNHETFSKACEYTNGAIIGSAFVKALADDGALEDKIAKFVNGILGK